MTTEPSCRPRRPIIGVPPNFAFKKPPVAEELRNAFHWIFGGLIALTLGLPAAADDKPAGSSPPPANNSRDVKKYVVVAELPGKLNKLDPASSEGELEYRAGIGRYARTDRATITFADDVKVWLVKPPEKIDENGNAHKMTPAELDKIKSKHGPTKGLFAGEMANLHAGQQVQVVLGRLKGVTKKPVTKDKAAAGEKDFIYVTQIVILSDDRSTRSRKSNSPMASVGA